MNWYKESKIEMGFDISKGQTWTMKNDIQDEVSVIDYTDSMVTVKRPNGRTRKISDDMLRIYFRYAFGSKKKQKLDSQL